MDMTFHISVNVLWILLVGDTAVLGHLVWSAYPSQTADHAAVSWVEEKFRKLKILKLKYLIFLILNMIENRNEIVKKTSKFDSKFEIFK